MRLSDSETLYERFCELEKEAEEIREEIERRLAEAGYIKVVRCKDCAYYENCLDTYMIPADCCPQGKRKEETE